MRVESPAGDWTLCSGLADTANATPMTPDTRLRIGSCTKTFTATASMMLVQVGALDVTEPIKTYIPEITVPHDSLITVANLLNMTSGLGDYLNDDDWVLSMLAADIDNQFTVQELLDHAFELTDVDEMDIGGDWSYCNTNYLLLTLIIQSCSGMSYTDYIELHITGPLGMSSTTISTEPFDLSHGYVDLDDDGIVDDVTSWNPTYTWGAGCIVSTVSDMAIFAGALYTDDLLSPSSFEQMNQWVEVVPEFSYGFGIGQYTELEIRGHNGAVPGYAAEMWFHQPSQTVITVLSNSNRIDGDHTFAVVEQALQILNGNETTRHPTGNSLAREMQ
ncbi:MAG: beta-lactamase family protein [Candidatus Cloacimonetes bacterium]|nr:beta-lactamase family protein [Candidatus Cloacimonadota bacterium]